jgi:hypothetical protein
MLARSSPPAVVLEHGVQFEWPGIERKGKLVPIAPAVCGRAVDTNFTSLGQSIWASFLICGLCGGGGCRRSERGGQLFVDMARWPLNLPV